MPGHDGPLAYRKNSNSAGAAALEAEARKRTKFSGLLHTYSFAPLAVDTWCLRRRGRGAAGRVGAVHDGGDSGTSFYSELT